MRFSLAIAFLLAGASPTSVAGFVNPQWGQSVSTSTVRLFSTLAAPSTVKEEPAEPAPGPTPAKFSGPLSGAEINARLSAQLEKLRQKDTTSPLLTKEELKVVFEDDHIVVVDKPSGVLTVSGKNGANSLAQSVYAASECKMEDPDRMVVHRLGMDTSGLIVFCKTIDAVRGMNAILRARTVERKYEALVCGHVKKDRGIIDLPLMRDYESQPFMRISTDEHQEALVDLDPVEVGKKLLEHPKESLTKYEVVSREELGGQPVTRITITSISGRTHQLNCHLAAFGHPIVGDSTYGIGGDAASNGGLTDDELKYLAPNPARSTAEQQTGANSSVDTTCCHAKSLKFRHPVTKEEVLLNSDAPF